MSAYRVARLVFDVRSGIAEGRITARISSHYLSSSLRHLNESRHTARHLRIKPAHAIRSDYKIIWIKNVALDEFQHFAVYRRPIWLHQIRYKSGRAVSSLMHDTNRRVISFDSAVNLQLALALHRPSALAISKWFEWQFSHSPQKFLEGGNRIAA